MSYSVLDKNNIPEYLRGIAKVLELLGDSSDLIVDEIGDGNLNFVFRAFCRDDPKKSVILKQSVPYLRVVGDGWPLDKKRIHFEMRALAIYGNLVPGNVPEVYHSDEEMCTLVMEDLRSHKVLRSGMIMNIKYPNVGRSIGTLLAKTLFGTSSFGMGSLDRHKYMEQFVTNDELCKLTEEFVFTYPLMVHSLNYVNPLTEKYANEHLRKDSDYKLGTLKLKETFISDKSALLHGDLHTGSLMANGVDLRVIDTEFACFGPLGFDVGKIIANFLLSYISHYQSPNDEYKEWVLEETFQILNTFSKTFLDLWDKTEESAMFTASLLNSEETKRFKEDYILKILRDSIGFCACFITRRTLGTAGVADIREIEDVVLRSKLEIVSLKLAQTLMSSHGDINSIEEFKNLVSAFFEKTKRENNF
ncbi:S-methyl-5-thioribose kinase [Puniceicoccaceae bacterium K14]|nr:S-methyl-5-thioribose kinase [Puniceicoccaceae bacterium K14]